MLRTLKPPLIKRGYIFSQEFWHIHQWHILASGYILLGVFFNCQWNFYYWCFLFLFKKEICHKAQVSPTLKQWRRGYWKRVNTKMQHLVLYVYAINNCLLSQNFLCELLNFVSEVGVVKQVLQVTRRQDLFVLFLFPSFRKAYIQLTEYKL